MTEIESYQRAGRIALSMAREAVHQALGAPEKSFLKSPLSKMPTDIYSGGAIHVYYRPPGFVEAIELFCSAAPEFEGRRLLERPFRDILAELSRLDDKLEADASGFTSREFGIAVYAPAALKDPGLPAEAVLVFERGYYD